MKLADSGAEEQRCQGGIKQKTTWYNKRIHWTGKHGWVSKMSIRFTGDWLPVMLFL